MGFVWVCSVLLKAEMVNREAGVAKLGCVFCILDGRCIRLVVGRMLVWPREEISGRNVGGEAQWKKLSS